MKRYSAYEGVLLDEDFPAHQEGCPRCAGVDLSRPASLSGLCLEGAVLFKRDHTQKRKALPGERDPFRGTRDQVRRATKYRDLS
jgi:hypothetical protein